MLPDFFILLFCYFFPVQQTTSGIGHRVNKSIFFEFVTITLNVRNNNHNNFAKADENAHVKVEFGQIADQCL